MSSQTGNLHNIKGRFTKMTIKKMFSRRLYFFVVHNRKSSLFYLSLFHPVPASTAFQNKYSGLLWKKSLYSNTLNLNFPVYLVAFVFPTGFVQTLQLHTIGKKNQKKHKIYINDITITYGEEKAVNLGWGSIVKTS